MSGCMRLGGWGEREACSRTLGFFWSDEVLQPIMVMLAQLCEYIKIHWTVHFKWINYILCKLYVNKVGFKKVVPQIHAEISIPLSTDRIGTKNWQRRPEHYQQNWPRYFLKRKWKHMFKTKTSVHGAFTHNRETGNKHLSTTGWMNILSYTHMTEYSERQ